MSSHFLTDKGLALESRFGGFAVAGAQAFPEPGVAPRYAPDRGVRVDHLDIELHIDPVAQTLSGRTTVTVSAWQGSLPNPVVLDLEDQAVSMVTDEAGRPLPYRLGDGVVSVSGLSGATARIQVAHSGKPSRGLYFTGPTPSEPGRPHMAWSQCQDEDGHYLFPCLDHPSVKQPVSVTVVAPAGDEVVSNGRLVSREVEGDQVRWRWVEERPIPAYLVTVIVGPLVVVDDPASQVPVRYLAPVGADPAVMTRCFHKTPAMIRLFEATFGVPYPWPRYDQIIVHDFIFGGMENAGATTLTDLVLTDDRAALDWDAEDLIAHELAHQWFGDLVTCQDWSQAWLNEGWATYSEYLWARHDLGADEAEYGLYGQLQGYLEEDGGSYRRSIVHYRFKNPIDLFDRHLYEKGGLVLHSLRTELGEAAFWAGTRQYLERHGGGTVHTRHLQRAMEEASGRNLDGFFQSRVEGAGHPTVEVSLAYGEGALSVSVKQTQSGEGVSEAFHFPLSLRVVGAEGTPVERVLRVTERERSFLLPLAEEPLRVEVDAHFSTLLELTLSGPRGWLLSSLQQDPGPVGRVRAGQALLKDGSKAAITGLCAALRADTFWGVRVELAGLLGKRGGEVAEAALILALDDPHPKVRKAIVTALGGVRSRKVVEALLARAEAPDASLQVEGELIKSLGRLRAPGNLARAEAALRRDAWNDLLRSRALEALGAAQDPAALPLLLSWTSPDKGARPRAAAAAALGRLADEVESTRRPAVDALLELAREAPFRVRMAAIGGLGAAKDPRSLALLHAIHESDGDGRLARTAWNAANRVAAGRSTEAGLSTLRADLDKLRDENKALRDRLQKVEDRGTT